MQLMCDAVSVLGSRHGMLWNLPARQCGIIRFDPYNQLPALNLRAGVVIQGKECLLPLCEDGGQFRFYDQRLSPCTMTLMGIDPASGIKLKLTIVTPFRPRDAVFSTIPILAVRLSVEEIPGNFRWEQKTIDLSEVDIFLEFTGPALTVEEAGVDAVDMRFTSARSITCEGKAVGEDVPQRDRLVALTGQRQGTRFVKHVTLGVDDCALDVAWCTWSEPVLEVRGERYPFKYAAQFPNLDAVADWARKHPTALFDNATAVDGIVARNNCSQSVNHLLAQTLHSWLINTWWTERGGRDWFSVWEGDCYFHSTVDVEFTQGPFYLAVWPELLKIELDNWPDYSKDGTLAIGDAGKGTLFLSHDVGNMEGANGQVYPHDMEVEENTNYIILSYAYYKRTGDDSTIRRHADILEKYLNFLIACDSTGDGVPDRGVANTIDDASPAVQYGREQVYLAVKTQAALAVGAEMMALLGRMAQAGNYRAQAEKIRTVVEERGWMGDHYATLLEKGGTLKDPWTGEVFTLDEIPGWDASHIYTENAIAVLDMVGFDLGLQSDRLRQDLAVAAERCLREYGCIHSDYASGRRPLQQAVAGLAGAAINPGWISMNMLRDIAAFYRGVDLRALADRYWEWQTTTNSQQPHIFFETFSGNNLCFYPRGIAVWGYFDALAGQVIDRTHGIDRIHPAFPQARVPRLYDADWVRGECVVIS